jgi:hypothetical protein
MVRTQRKVLQSFRMREKKKINELERKKIELEN